MACPARPGRCYASEHLNASRLSLNVAENKSRFIFRYVK